MTTHPSALDRDTRRNTLLDFADRQYPTDVERSLAATLLRIEFGEIDQAHAKAERAARDARDGRNRAKMLEGRLDLGTERLRRARGQRDEARQQLAELNAAYGADLRSVERERDDARDAYDRAERELAAAKAEAEGLAETMRNTDRLTEQQLADTRSALRAERGRADSLGAQFRDRRHALSQALGLGTSAPWDAITERARELHALTETAGTAVSASDVLVQHDVTRKAMCDALGVGYHLNWQQIIDSAQRSHNANAEWQRESEEHRHALAEALACFPTSSWADLASIAAERITQRQRAEDRAERAERHAAADVAAARQAEELAGRTLAMRHQRLAEALHCDLGTSWRDLIQLAGDRTGVVAAMRQTVTRAEQNAAAARQAEAEAVRARQAAEAQASVEREHAEEAIKYRGVVERENARLTGERDTAERKLAEARCTLSVHRDELAHALGRDSVSDWGELVDIATGLPDAERRLALADSVKRSAAGDAANALRRAERAEAAIARVRKATDALTPLAARHIEEAIAEPEPKPREVCCVCRCPDVTYHNHREQPLCCRCAMCCEPPTLCAHGCQPPAEATAEAEEQREQPAEPLLRGIDLTGYTAGMQAFMTAYVRAVAPALDQVARALGVDQDRH